MMVDSAFSNCPFLYSQSLVVVFVYMQLNCRGNINVCRAASELSHFSLKLSC